MVDKLIQLTGDIFINALAALLFSVGIYVIVALLLLAVSLPVQVVFGSAWAASVSRVADAPVLFKVIYAVTFSYLMFGQLIDAWWYKLRQTWR